MRCAVLFAFLVALSASDLASGQDKGKKKEKEAATIDPQDEALLRKAGEVAGRLMKITSTARYLSIQVPWAGNQRMTPQRANASGLRAALGKQGGNKRFDLEFAEDVKIRTLAPKLQFDDKGKPKPYTKEELKALRDKDPGIPGYPAEFSDLKEGQIIDVVFAKKGKAPAAADKDKDKGDEAAGLRVATVIILADADTAAGRPKK